MGARPTGDFLRRERRVESGKERILTCASYACTRIMRPRTPARLLSRSITIRERIYKKYTVTFRAFEKSSKKIVFPGRTKRKRSEERRGKTFSLYISFRIGEERKEKIIIYFS